MFTYINIINTSVMFEVAMEINEVRLGNECQEEKGQGS